MGKQQGNDFSKIQARFANRMKLTSADVAEVIQKRLLAKNEDGVHVLSDVYHEQSNNFKTLFDFADGSQTFRNFQDRDHFIHSYPFIPYQFALFQSAIQNLSQHTAFEGRHSSVGERSMLGVFQQVAIQIGDHKVGQLATFDLMFEGIRTALKSNIQRAIIQAENHLEDAFAVQLLKTLFLVKYVKEFKPTVRNLCVLMLDSFGKDLPALKKQIEESLALLEQQTYVQRHGELYEFLTDEEKDVEQEIKNTEVEESEVAAELERIIFDHVIKHRKIRYGDNGQDYSFSKKLDDRLYGREYELAIHVISPFNENAGNETILRSQSMGRDELLVLMPTDERIVRDLLMYKRTEKYIRQNISITQQEAVKRILENKGYQNRERSAQLQQRVQSLMGKAKLLVAGTEVEVSSEDGQTRVLRGAHELISLTYPNLRMLRGIAYTEEMLKTILRDKDGTLFGSGATPLAESEQELLAFIQSNDRGGVRTTLKSLLERFERKPYGWYYAAILCTLANLFVRGKVELRSDSNLIEEDELERVLRNTQNHGNVQLFPQIEFTASQVRALKEFYEDFFDAPSRANEAKALGTETGESLKVLIHELEKLAAQASQYPFLNALRPAIEKINELSGKPYAWYLTELLRDEDSLLEMKEEVVDPVRKFMNGSRKEIFDQARKFVQEQRANFAYIESDEADQIAESLNDPECFKGNRMQQLKAHADTLQKKLDDQIADEIEKAKEAIGGLKERLCRVPEFDALIRDQQEQITRPFDEFAANIEREKLIPIIRETRRRFEEKEYQELLSKMTSWVEPAPAPQADGNSAVSDGVKPSSSTRMEPKVKYVPMREVKISFDKAWLADETDVERYLDSMSDAFLEEIQQGKRVQI